MKTRLMYVYTKYMVLQYVLALMFKFLVTCKNGVKLFQLLINSKMWSNVIFENFTRLAS